MKTKLFLLFTSIIYLNINAQIIEHIISATYFEAGSIFAADFDGDGDMDVLSAGGNTIDWWENLDGFGNFGPQQNITTDVDRPYQILAADVNGDGWMDVLSVSRDDDKLAWYENTDGLGTFGPQQLITAQANVDGARFVDWGDIDGDGLKDVVSASWNDNKIAWYRNLGNGDFGDINTNQHIISVGEMQAISVHITKIDGDDRNDVVAVSWTGGEIFWFKNIDPLNNDWERHLIEAQRDKASSVSSADFDGDGDMDLVSTSWDDNDIKWHKNIDGDGLVWENITVTFALRAVYVYATDYNENGNWDFLAASAFDDRIVLYVYDGNDNFYLARKFPITTANFPVSVHAANIDAVPGKDLLSASVLDSKLAWYEYILSVNDNFLLDFSVYPNPTKGILNIQSKTNIVQIDIYNLLGQLVLSNSNKNTIDISSVSQGLYFIKVKDENGDFGSKKIVKN